MRQQAFYPALPPTEFSRKKAFAPIVEVTVRFERVANATMHVQILAGSQFEGCNRAQASCCSASGNVVRRSVGSPGTKLRVGARKLHRRDYIRQLMLDGLVRG